MSAINGVEPLHAKHASSPHFLHRFHLPKTMDQLGAKWSNPLTALEQHESARNYARAYVSSDARIYAFDLDGTLINGHANPLKAGFTPEAVQALRALAADPKNHVVFVTARPLDWVLSRMEAAGLSDVPISVMAGAGRNNAFTKQLAEHLENSGDFIGAGKTIGINGSKRYLLQHKDMQSGQERLESFLKTFRDEYVRIQGEQNGAGEMTITHDDDGVQAQMSVSNKPESNAQRRRNAKANAISGEPEIYTGYWPFLDINTPGIDFSAPGKHEVSVRFEIKEGLMTINFSPRGAGDPHILEQVVKNLAPTLEALGLRVEGNHEVMTLDALPPDVEKGRAVAMFQDLVAKATGARLMLTHLHGDSYNDIAMTRMAHLLKQVNDEKCTVVSAVTVVARTNRYLAGSYQSPPLNPKALMDTANFILANPDTLATHLSALGHTRSPEVHTYSHVAHPHCRDLPMLPRGHRMSMSTSPHSRLDQINGNRPVRAHIHKHLASAKRGQ